MQRFANRVSLVVTAVGALSLGLPVEGTGQVPSKVRYSLSVGYHVADLRGDDLQSFSWDWRLAVDYRVFNWGTDQSVWLNHRVGVGAGRQEGALGVDPARLDLGFALVAESRFQSLTAWGGLDHASFHLIDTYLESSIWYWRVIGGLGSTGSVRVLDEADVPGTFSVPSPNRIEWGVNMAWWPKSLPIVGTESSVGNPWIFAGLATVRARAFRRKGWELGVAYHGAFQHERTNWEWRDTVLMGASRAYQMVGAQLSRSAGEFAWGMNVDVMLTDNRRPRFNRKGLVRVSVALGN